MSGIVWLASYPKSGNTWFRVFLTNYLRDSDQPASINDLFLTPIASARYHFDEILAVDAGDFTADEYDCLRPDVYRGIAVRAVETPYMKVHDAYLPTLRGEPLLPAEATDRALYFVRDPRDVAVSYAHHDGTTPADAIAAMNGPNNAFCSGVRGMAAQLRQRVSTWSGHVESWLDQTPFPVHAMRYEDMVDRPAETFAGAISFLGLPLDDARIQKALRFSSFEELQTQETKGGFREAPVGVDRFFRRGQPGSWADQLSVNEASTLVSDHEVVMRRLGYLDSTRGGLQSSIATGRSGSN